MIEILMVRDPDMATEIRVFRDGVEIEWPEVYIVDVDAGRGWEYDDWQDSAKDAFEGGTSIKFRSAVFDAYADPPGKEYIDGWPDECPAGGEHRAVPDSDENDDMRTFSSKTWHCDECGVSLPSPEREP